MKMNTGGSKRRRIMEENLTEEYFFTLLDGAEALLGGDSLREEHPEYDYTVTVPEKKAETVSSFDEDIASCHRCQSCFSRRVYAEPTLNPDSDFLFVLPSPEGDTMLSADSYSYYTKWVKAMGREMRNVSITSLIRCPVPFRKEAADSCRDYLREEMKSLRPKAIVLLGEETAQYMLRRQLPLDNLRLHSYRINGIRTFVTYTPLSLVRDRSLRGKIWEDLKYIMNETAVGENRA